MLKSAILGRVVRAERNGRRVRLGLGGERYGIAWLNRSGLLQPVLSFGTHAARFLLRCAQSSVIYRRLVRRVSRHAVVRPASAEDVRRAYAWLNATSPAASPAQDQPEVTDFVAEVGSQLAGFVQLVYHPPDHAPYVGYWLFSLNVRARYRGAGIGETLTRAVMAKAKNDGAGELRLLVYSDNLPAIRLYHKLGFWETVVAGLQPQLDEEAAQTGRRRIVMQIDLQRARR